MDVIELLWFDPKSLARIRNTAGFRSVLEALRHKSIDRDVDDPAFAEEPREIEDRREVREVLALGDAVDVKEVAKAPAAGKSGEGPVVLLRGKLHLPFNEMATLRAVVATATPFAGGDERLQQALETANDFLKMPDLRSGPATLEGLVDQIRDAFEKGRQKTTAGYLDSQTERALLCKRLYQKRAVFGEPHVRALLSPPDATQPIPTYLPVTLIQWLPMFQRFGTSLIAEVHSAVDQYETYPAALRVMALGRVVKGMGNRE